MAKRKKSSQMLFVPASDPLFHHIFFLIETKGRNLSKHSAGITDVLLGYITRKNEFNLTPSMLSFAQKKLFLEGQMQRNLDNFSFVEKPL